MASKHHPNYRLWLNIKSRTTIDPDWEDNFELFNNAIGDKPTPKSRLVRKDKSLGYLKNNVYWRDSSGETFMPIPKLDNSMSINAKLRLIAQLNKLDSEFLEDTNTYTINILDEHLNKVIADWKALYISKCLEFCTVETEEELASLDLFIEKGFKQWLECPEMLEALDQVKQEFLLRNH